MEKNKSRITNHSLVGQIMPENQRDSRVALAGELNRVGMGNPRKYVGKDATSTTEVIRQLEKNKINWGASRS